MKLEIIKSATINEQIKNQKQIAPTPLISTAKVEPVEVGKEAVFKNAEEQHKKAEKEIAKTLEPAKKSSDETVKITASEESKTKTAKKLVKDRKELVALITEAKAKNQVYKISRSLTEGFRYEVFIKDNLKNLKEGAEGKKTPGYKWVIYCADEKDPKYDTIVAIRSTYTEAQFYWMQHLDKDLGIELVKDENAVMGKNMKDIIEEAKESKSDKEEKPKTDAIKTDDVLPDVTIKTPVIDTDKVDTTVLPTNSETPELTSNPEVLDSEPTPEQTQTAIESMLNNLISEKFKDVDDVKSIIASIIFAGGNDEVINILNNVIDDTTMHIGMIQKALGLVSPETEQNIKAGTDKANDLTAKTNIENDKATEAGKEEIKDNIDVDDNKKEIKDK